MAVKKVFNGLTYTLLDLANSKEVAERIKKLKIKGGYKVRITKTSAKEMRYGLKYSIWIH